jgi:hypothetical protein
MLTQRPPTRLTQMLLMPRPSISPARRTATHRHPRCFNGSGNRGVEVTTRLKDQLDQGRLAGGQTVADQIGTFKTVIGRDQYCSSTPSRSSRARASFES